MKDEGERKDEKRWVRAESREKENL